MMDTVQLLANSWSFAAAGYNSIFVPRFAPWTADVLECLVQEQLPQIISTREKNEKEFYSCCVPCCGPGKELEELANILISGRWDKETWSILGVDVAPGMIKLVNEKLSDNREFGNQVQGIVQDCSIGLPPPLKNKYHDIIVSIFGFQQMSDPSQVLKMWLDALDPVHGRLILCFWPSSIEEHKNTKNNDKHGTLASKYRLPFTIWSDIVRQRIQEKEKEQEGELANSTNPRISSATSTKNATSWDDLVVGKVNELGGEVLVDKFLTHDIEWDSFDQFWEGMTVHGPWHATRLRRGDNFVDGLRDKYFKALNLKDDERLIHSARARLLVLRRVGGRS